MMGLGRRKGPNGENLVSLLEVSKQRLPVYTILLESVVVLGVVLAVVSTIELGECACLKSIAHFVGALAEYLNSYVSGAILMCGAVEGSSWGWQNFEEGRVSDRRWSKGSSRASSRASSKVSSKVSRWSANGCGRPVSKSRQSRIPRKIRVRQKIRATAAGSPNAVMTDQERDELLERLAADIGRREGGHVRHEGDRLPTWSRRSMR